MIDKSKIIEALKHAPFNDISLFIHLSILLPRIYLAIPYMILGAWI